MSHFSVINFNLFKRFLSYPLRKIKSDYFNVKLNSDSPAELEKMSVVNVKSVIVDWHRDYPSPNAKLLTSSRHYS